MHTVEEIAEALESDVRSVELALAVLRQSNRIETKADAEGKAEPQPESKADDLDIPDFLRRDRPAPEAPQE